MKNVLFLLSFLVLSSCTSKETLSNDAALQLISEKFDKKCYGNITTIFADNWKNYQELKTFWQNLERDYSVSIKSGNVAAGGIGQTVFQMRITPSQSTRNEFMQDKKYLQARGKVSKIIGISINEEAKSASVKYEYIYEPTSFYPPASINKRCSLEPQQATAELTLYDTGWKVESVEESPYAKLLGQ